MNTQRWIVPVVRRLQKSLARSRSAVLLAVKIRNQCQWVVHWYLGEDDRRELNGEKGAVAVIAPACRTFMDVGANVGDWTDLFLRAGGDQMQGVLIEPSRSAMARLQERFRNRTGISMVRAAASDQAGEAIFSEEADAGQTSSLVQSFSHSSSRKVTVQVTTVDEEAARAGLTEIDMLKIDTEGFDLHVLHGAKKMLSEGRIGILQFEYNTPWARAGSTLAAAISLLEGYGYQIFLLRSTGLHPLNYELYGEYFRYSNFLAALPRKLSVLAPMIREKI